MKLKYVNNEDQHAYYLDGKRAKGVTTVAKIPDNTYNLEQWAKRMVAIGLAENPVYVEAVAAHFNDKNECDRYVQKAYEAAKASHGADRGVAVHRFTERHDLSEPIIETPLSAYVISSWKAALEAADLEVLPDFVERIVVHPDRRICGRLDRILRRRSDGRLFVGDVKGGARAIQYPHAMACQVGLYANAPLIAAPIPNSGGETTQFDPMPDVDKEIGYIFHLPESGEAAVAAVDIAGGWDITTRAIFPILDWRDRKDICKPVAIVGGGEPVPATPQPQVEQAPPAGKRRTFGDEIRARTPVTPVETEPLADPAAVAALERRYDKLSGDAKAWVDSIAAQSHDAGYTLNTATRTVRQYEISRALVRFASLDPDDRLLRGAVDLIVGFETRPIQPSGQIIASFTLEQAEALNAIAVAIHGGQRTVIYLDDTAQLPAA